MHETIQLLLEKDDVTWKQILYDLVRNEQMNPWDIDVSVLSQKYIETIKNLKQHDFRISGKVLLAAAILLKIKTEHLLEHGMGELDRLLARTQEQMDDNFFSEFSQDLFNVAEKIDEEKPPLIPRTPQPRHRKITIYDLAEALQQALEVKKRKLEREHPTIKITIPKRKFDITQVIRDIYSKIKTYFHQNEKPLTFTQLLPQEATREEKAFTFIPLLHLDNQRKIDLLQKEHFGTIGIELVNGKKAE
ncbi:MAG TPA: segregation/condensation protein A [Candidatus Nanoarchaeia archaeon]|nr:segregation/condensation protein A [Candidatus Nanoarchaeia archaeon]